MLTLRTFTVDVLALNQIAIAWTIDSTDEDISKFRFTLSRSNSPGGPFERIAPDFINTFQFVDETEQMKSNWRKFYYQLTITDVRQGPATFSPVVGLTGQPDYILLEIRKRNRMYLHRFVGVPAAILIARTFGQRCPQCWDPIKQRSRESQCLMCFSTGFVGGYFPQINTYVNFSPSEEMVALLELGEQQPNPASLWLNYYPAISDRDIIVEHKNQKRWRVGKIGKTEKLRVLSRQIATIKEINRNDIEYKIPVVPFKVPIDTFVGFAPPEGSGLL